MTNEVIRGDKVFHKAVADVYDFDQQGETVWQPLWNNRVRWYIFAR